MTVLFLSVLVALAGCEGPGGILYVPKGADDYGNILGMKFDGTALNEISFIDETGHRISLDEYAGKTVVIHGTKSGFAQEGGQSLDEFIELQTKFSEDCDVIFLNVYSNELKRPNDDWRMHARNLGWMGHTYEVSREDADKLFGGRFLFVYAIIDNNGKLIYKTNYKTRIQSWDGFVRYIMQEVGKSGNVQERVHETTLRISKYRMQITLPCRWALVDLSKKNKPSEKRKGIQIARAGDKNGSEANIIFFVRKKSKLKSLIEWANEITIPKQLERYSSGEGYTVINKSSKHMMLKTGQKAFVYFWTVNVPYLEELGYGASRQFAFIMIEHRNRYYFFHVADFSVNGTENRYNKLVEGMLLPGLSMF